MNKKILLILLSTLILGFSFISVSAMTEAEKQALIAQLQAQISQLTAQVQVMIAQQQSTGTSTTSNTWCYTFNNNLGYAQSGNSEVGHLHTALTKQGILYSPDTGNTYGEPTMRAVQQFQAKYNISPQSGWTGPLTRAKLNELYKCQTGIQSQSQQNIGWNTWGTAQSNCTPSWQEGDWSACTNGTQTRTVTDRNNCGINTNKPVTSRSCTIKSIDIKINGSDGPINIFTTLSDGASVDGVSGINLSKNINLSWTGTNVSSCVASDNLKTQTFTGYQPSSGSKTVVLSGKIDGGVNGSYSNSKISANYKINCILTTTGAQVSDTITVNMYYSVNSLCTPNWQCSQTWSSCVSGKQTKNCIDVNGCGTNVGKPASQTQTCTTTCTESNWNSSTTPSTCPSSGTQTKTWTKVGTCTGGVTKPSSETITCTANTTTCTESNWNSSTTPSTCPASGTQTRTWTKVGTCTGGVTKPSSETITCINTSTPSITVTEPSQQAYLADQTDGNGFSYENINIRWSGSNIPANATYKITRKDFHAQGIELPVPDYQIANNLPSTTMSYSSKVYSGIDSNNQIEFFHKIEVCAIGPSNNIIVCGESIPFGVATPASGKSITLTSPNGGENWQIGSTRNITWQSSGVSNVVIGLQKMSSNAVWYLSNSAPASSGSYSWTISEDLPPGNDYRIAIVDKDNGAILDISNNYFTISSNIPAEFVRIITPNGNQNYRLGSKIMITWQTSSNIELVSLGLRDEDGNLWPIAYYIPNTGSYEWTVYKTPAMGEYCKIEIAGVTTYQTIDSSDNYFRIYSL